MRVHSATIRAAAEDDVRAIDAVLRANDDPPPGVAGPSPLLPALLAAGFRIRDRDTFMASDPDLIEPARILANTGIL